MLELQHLFDVDRTEEIYFSAIEGKTASLFATACRIGGMVAEVEGPTLDALTEFGHHLGMCFQIVDDVLDVTGSDASLGKPAGNDLIEGVYTLPVIFALDRDARRCATCSAASSTTTRSRRRAGSPTSDGAVDAALGAARDQAARADKVLAGDRRPRPRGHRAACAASSTTSSPATARTRRFSARSSALWCAVSVPRTEWVTRTRRLGLVDGGVEAVDLGEEAQHRVVERVRRLDHQAVRGAAEHLEARRAGSARPAPRRRRRA